MEVKSVSFNRAQLKLYYSDGSLNSTSGVCIVFVRTAGLKIAAKQRGEGCNWLIWLTRLYQMLSCVSDNTAK